MKGDNVAGVIDVLGALTGLLNLIPGGSFIAIPLSIGLDMLNAWLDAKTAGAENKNTAKMDILKDMAKSIGDWIWKNALWLPVIGGFKRWGMAYDAFKGGNIMEGLKQFGLGILSFGGMGPIIMGIEALMGFFGNEESQTDLQPNTSWFGNFKKWIKDKLKKLPYALRKPLEWFGILDEDSSTPEPSMDVPKQSGGMSTWFSGLWGGVTSMFDDAGKWFSGLWDKVSTWFSGLWDKVGGWFSGLWDKLGNIDEFFAKIWEKISPIFNNIGKWFIGLWDKVSTWFSGIWEKISPVLIKWFSGLWEKLSPVFDGIIKLFSGLFEKIQNFLSSEFVTGIMEKVKVVATSVVGIISDIFDILKKVVDSVRGIIKNLNIFGGNEDPQALENAKKMGWNSVEEYKNSGWKSNPDNKIEVVNEKRKEHVDDLVLIGKEQISILSDIRRIGMETLKVMSSNTGGGSSNPIIISNSSGGSNSKPSSQISLNTSRGDYSSSPYAFA
jgi:hypothetical protein